MKRAYKMIQKPLTIGLVYDLRDEYLVQGYTEQQVAEFDSDSTIQALEHALCQLGHRPERIGNGPALASQLVAGRRWDLVFNISEGLWGRSREAQVPALLEMYGVPYTFSDPLACALTLDKAMAKRIVQSSGVQTPKFAVVDKPEQIESVNVPFPIFAKPVAEGTGKGVDHRSRIDSRAQIQQVCLDLLDRFRQPVLVEEYLPGREFTTAILGTGPGSEVLGTMEMTISADAPAIHYSYEVKEQCERYVDYFEMPRGELRGEVEALSLAAYRALECRDAGRVDVRLDAKGRPYFIEINPLPGLHPTHSDLPMIATQQGMAYEDLIGRIVNSALTRQEETLCHAVRC